jgi:ribonuclease R
MPHLQHLYSVYQLMLKQREKRGAIEFESSETMMMFNDNGKIDKIVPSTRNEAHKLIEECMLAANVCAAEFLMKHEHAALYRIHEGPTPEKLEALRLFMGEFGFGVGGGEKPQAKDYGKLMARIKERPDAQLLQTVMLRSMQQAVYSPDNVGHFGLAYDAYAHFTSPIRRYPDLLIHRAIKAVVSGEKYNAKDWHGLGTHCSMTERRADDATRDVTNWLKCFYMQDKIGEIFEGTVAGVTSFGLFVALDEVYVEGLLHVTELGNDYFVFDKARHEMLGERTGMRYRLGDRLTIKVARVDLETSKMDFALVSNGKSRQVADATQKDTSSQHVFEEEPSKKTLRVTKPPIERIAETKPKTTRALDKAKKERSVAQKAATKNVGGAKSGGGKSTPNHAGAGNAGKSPAKTKNRLKHQKSKGKPKH